MTVRTTPALAGALAGALLVDLVPSVTAMRSFRMLLAPALSGAGAVDHVAITIDDGPDPAVTPRVLERLAELGIRATFFVLADALRQHPRLGRRLVDEGHEVALHGVTHRPHLLRTPAAVAADLRRGHRIVHSVTGAAPRFWRPPHGIPTATGLAVSRRLGMRPVLWTADGRDWRADATSASVLGRIAHQLHGGGVVLLHDGRTAAPSGSWPITADVLPDLAELCRRNGWRPGPLGEHGRRSNEPEGRSCN